MVTASVLCPAQELHGSQRPAVNLRFVASVADARRLSMASRSLAVQGRMISPPVKCSTSNTWYLDRAAGSSSSSSCVRGYQPRPSRPSWPGAAWMACADNRAADGAGRSEPVRRCS
eukprot:scaffold101943_cov32-Phaeocystis_antarctica.AAC.1